MQDDAHERINMWLEYLKVTKIMGSNKVVNLTNSKSNVSNELHIVKIVHKNKFVMSNSKIPLNEPTKLNLNEGD